MSELLPVQNPEAERAVLGALLTNPEGIRRVPTLRAADFYEPRHGVIYRAVQDALESREGVVDELVILEQLRSTGDLQRSGGGPYLHTLIESCPTITNIDYYAVQVIEAARRRELESLGMRIQQAARGAVFEDVVHNVSRFADEIAATVRPDAAAERVEGLHEWGEFVDQDAREYDWLIPGLLERMDRVILVAGEGAGKTMLMRQVALCVAAGLHPFVPQQKIRPHRTLLVDLENPPNLVRRKGGHLVGVLRSQNVWTADRAFLWTQTGGLDLRRPADLMLFDRVLTETRPGLVLLGPLYKSFMAGRDNADQANREVAGILDRLRAKHRFALMIEHHAPLDQSGRGRELRPFGSLVWSQWPEFGIALQKDRKRDQSGRTLRLDRFRGDRDERRWPVWLERGSVWPWLGVWDDHIPGWGQEELTG